MMNTTDIVRESLPLARSVVLEAADAVAVVLVPLNPRGICETDAIRIGSEIWVVPEWHESASLPRCWRPKRMIRTERFRYSCMGSRLVLNEPMLARVFDGRYLHPDHQVWIHPEVHVHFGAALPVAEAAARRREQMLLLGQEETMSRGTGVSA